MIQASPGVQGPPAWPRQTTALLSLFDSAWFGSGQSEGQARGSNASPGAYKQSAAVSHQLSEPLSLSNGSHSLDLQASGMGRSIYPVASQSDTSMVGIHESQQPPVFVQQEAKQATPVLGTWADRKFMLPLPVRSETTVSTSPRQSAPQAVPPARNGSRDNLVKEDRSSTDDEAEVQAAWRWRFTKKWMAEQARVVDPNQASNTSDTMEEALQYLNACGEGWNLHLAREGSTEVSSSGHGHTALGTLGTPGVLTAEMLVEDSFSANKQKCLSQMLAMEGAAPASREVANVTKRAKQLLRHQQTIEKQIDERWKEVATARSGDGWVGNFVTAVEVDDWGTFKFVMLRMKDRQNKQKLLIRGHNHSTEASLVEEANRQMLQLSAQHGLPVEMMEMIGSGVMEWRRDRDRHLRIHSGVVSAPDTAGMKASELINLAGVLTKQSLPIHYKVSIAGGKVL